MYKICDQYINIQGFVLNDPSWKAFEINRDSDLDLSVSVCGQPSAHYGLEIFPPQPGPVQFKCDQALLSANEDWSKVQITLLDGKPDGLNGALSGALMTHLSTRQGLLAHASLVDINGRGLMFLGPSGIGKTTQARLWETYGNGLIINGDLVFVAYRDHQYQGFGSPWHGSSPYCENRQVPLAGLVILEQAPENKIRQLHGFEAIDRVMSNIFLPVWHEAGVDGVCELLDGLLTAIPVYLLRCRPDCEAVNITANAVFGEKSPESDV